MIHRVKLKIVVLYFSLCTLSVCTCLLVCLHVYACVTLPTHHSFAHSFTHSPSLSLLCSVWVYGYVCLYVYPSRVLCARECDTWVLAEKSAMMYTQEIDYKKKKKKKNFKRKREKKTERHKNKENNEQETRYHLLSYNNYIMYVWAWSSSQPLFKLCTNSM
jgi:hypothetical protein